MALCSSYCNPASCCYGYARFVLLPNACSPRQGCAAPGSQARVLSPGLLCMNFPTLNSSMTYGTGILPLPRSSDTMFGYHGKHSQNREFPQRQAFLELSLGSGAELQAAAVSLLFLRPSISPLTLPSRHQWPAPLHLPSQRERSPGLLKNSPTPQRAPAADTEVAVSF